MTDHMTAQPAMTVELLPFADQMPAMRAAMAKALPDISQDILHHALLTALRAVTPSPPDGWMPIETAPKDGRKILLAWPSGVCVGWFEKRTSNTFRSNWRRDIFGLGDTTAGAEPTHWRELPPAPKSKG